MNAIAGFFGMILKYILDFTGSYGLSIIIFTILIKLLLTPLAIKQTKSTFAMSTINPKIKEIQEKYKNKPEKQNEEIAKLYKESDINPLSGCLPLLIQLPILYALFYVFRNPVAHGVFASNAEFMSASTQFLWIKSFVKPDYILAFMSGISALGMMFITTPRDQMKGPMMPMLIMMPLLSFWWGFTFPAGLTLYWTISNLFQALQYIVITKPLKDKLEKEKSDNKFDAKVSGRK